MSEITATKEQQNKYEALKEYLRSLGSVAVAFSSGVDSTFLLKTAHDVLGDKCIAITAMSCSFPKRELEEAKTFCEKEGIRHITVESEELEIEGFCQNPTNRCYICKKELFEKIWDIARKEGLNAVAEGSNMDDNGDYRPGLQAVAELGVKSPLRHSELYKEDSILCKRNGTSDLGQTVLCLSFLTFRLRRRDHREQTFHGRPGRTAASGSGISSASCAYSWYIGTN